jgi:hypothetical protein
MLPSREPRAPPGGEAGRPSQRLRTDNVHNPATNIHQRDIDILHRSGTVEGKHQALSRLSRAIDLPTANLSGFCVATAMGCLGVLRAFPEEERLQRAALGFLRKVVLDAQAKHESLEFLAGAPHDTTRLLGIAMVIQDVDVQINGLRVLVSLTFLQAKERILSQFDDLSGYQIVLDAPENARRAEVAVVNQDGNDDLGVPRHACEAIYHLIRADTNNTFHIQEKFKNAGAIPKIACWVIANQTDRDLRDHSMNAFDELLKHGVMSKARPSPLTDFPQQGGVTKKDIKAKILELQNFHTLVPSINWLVNVRFDLLSKTNEKLVHAVNDGIFLGIASAMEQRHHRELDWQNQVLSRALFLLGALNYDIDGGGLAMKTCVSQRKARQPIDTVIKILNEYNQRNNYIVDVYLNAMSALNNMLMNLWSGHPFTYNTQAPDAVIVLLEAARLGLADVELQKTALQVMALFVDKEYGENPSMKQRLNDNGAYLVVAQAIRQHPDNEALESAAKIALKALF